MKKILLLSAAACCMILYACKKDETTTTPVTEETKPAIDPVALAATIKVGYSATSDTGAIPSASSDAGAPVLDTRYDNQTYYAVNNRYVVIYPQSLSGAVKGYYLKINGANTHFKIDYTTAYNLRKAKSTGFAGLREGDNSDSSIVIKLPAGLKGDTFSIKYAAYDTLNRVSNTLTAIVSLVATDSSSNSLLAGTWRYNRYKHNDNDWDEPENYTMDSATQDYTCVDGHLEPGCSQESCMNIAYERSGETAYDMIFSANNQYSEHYARTNEHLNTKTSTCTNLVYDNNGGYDDVYPGGYSYNATTKEFIIIYDGHNDRDQGSNITTYRYTVTEISSTKIVYYGKYNDGNKLSFDYYEYLKK